MKKILLSYLITCGFVSAYAANGTVSASGDWSSKDTWSNGVVPTTSSTSPLDYLDFASDNLTVNVNSNQYMAYVNGGSNTNSTINIASGSTLYTTVGTPSSTRTFAITDSASNVVRYTGGGTLQLGVSGGEAFFRKGNYIFDTTVNSLIHISFQTATGSESVGKATFNNNCTVTGQISVGSGWSLVFSEGVYVKLSNAFTFWGLASTSMLEVKKGATIESNSGGTRLSCGKIDGTIIAKGASNNGQANKYALKLGYVTFNSSSSLSQTKVNGYKALVVGDIIVVPPIKSS